MAVAEKNLTETTPRNAVAQLALTSILGAVYLYAAILVVFHGIPAVWDQFIAVPLGMNLFVSGTIRFFLELGGACLAAAAGYRLLARNEIHGTRAGIFSLALLAFLALVLFCEIGTFLEGRIEEKAIGLLIAAILPVVLLFFGYRIAFRAAFGRWMAAFEDQGWFTSRPFKASQGMKVRRGTILGLLVLGGCGIYTMINQNVLRGAGNWILSVPFSSVTIGTDIVGLGLYVLPDLRFSVPLLLIALMGWMAWRIVNWPAFADFLIATEAEMNKVSWTTRKRLVQDTVVVLVTVILLTVFLFLVDIMWIRTLSWSWINVLQIDPMKERAKLKEQSQW